MSSRSQPWQSGRLLEIGQLSHQGWPSPNQSGYFGRSPPSAQLPRSFPWHPCPGPSWHAHGTRRGWVRELAWAFGFHSCSGQGKREERTDRPFQSVPQSPLVDCIPLAKSKSSLLWAFETLWALKKGRGPEGCQTQGEDRKGTPVPSDSPLAEIHGLASLTSLCPWSPLFFPALPGALLDVRKALQILLPSGQAQLSILPPSV